MKIMYVIDSHPENGGAPISTCNIAQEIAKKYSTVLVMPFQEKKYVLNESLSIRELEGFYDRFPLVFLKPLKFVKLVYTMKKVIQEINPDVIHVQMPRGAWAIGFLKKLRLIPKRIILVYTDRDYIESYGKLAKFISVQLINKIYNELICLTELGALNWKKCKGKANISVIPNYAGDEYEIYDSSMHQQIRNEHGISGSDLTVMFCGRMSIYKNWDLAKDIILNIKNHGLKFIFAISTMNKDQEVRFNDFLKKMDDEDVDYIIFHNASQKDMARYYYMVDILVMTSDIESFGRTAIEAMSRKCVVIGRNVGGLPEVIGKSENILEKIVSSFTDRIKFYDENRKELQNDKNWFFKRFNSNFTSESSIAKHIEVYKKNTNKK